MFSWLVVGTSILTVSRWPAGTVRRDGTALVATSPFLNHLGSSRSRLFAVRRPDELRTVQRRAEIRMDACCPLEYTAVGVSEAGVPHPERPGPPETFPAGPESRHVRDGTGRGNRPPATPRSRGGTRPRLSP
jgi:hypothetical protein